MEWIAIIVMAVLCLVCILAAVFATWRLPREVRRRRFAEAESAEAKVLTDHMRKEMARRGETILSHGQEIRRLAEDMDAAVCAHEAVRVALRREEALHLRTMGCEIPGAVEEIR